MREHQYRPPSASAKGPNEKEKRPERTGPSSLASFAVYMLTAALLMQSVGRGGQGQARRVAEREDEDAQPVTIVFLPNSSIEPHTLERTKICLPWPFLRSGTNCLVTLRTPNTLTPMFDRTCSGSLRREEGCVSGPAPRDMILTDKRTSGRTARKA